MENNVFDGEKLINIIHMQQRGKTRIDMLKDAIVQADQAGDNYWRMQIDGMVNMDKEEKQLIINETIKMLDEYGVSSYDDWDNQDEEESMELYENMKAGILEKFGIDDEDMNIILDEIFDEYLC